MMKGKRVSLTDKQVEKEIERIRSSSSGETGEESQV